MRKVEITCDQCGSDLTLTGNCEDYRIVLANESVPSGGGFVTSMAMYPPLEGTAHFCGTSCLGKWVSVKYPEAAENYDKMIERRAAVARRMEAANESDSDTRPKDGDAKQGSTRE